MWYDNDAPANISMKRGISLTINDLIKNNALTHFLSSQLENLLVVYPLPSFGAFHWKQPIVPFGCENWPEAISDREYKVDINPRITLLSNHLPEEQLKYNHGSVALRSPCLCCERGVFACREEAGSVSRYIIWGRGKTNFVSVRLQR